MYDETIGKVLKAIYDSEAEIKASSPLWTNYSSGGMAKDVGLYRRAVDAQASPSVIGPVTAAVWERFAAAEPGADFTRIFPFVEGIRVPPETYFSP